MVANGQGPWWWVVVGLLALAFLVLAWWLLHRGRHPRSDAKAKAKAKAVPEAISV
jgi:ABC-type dipeptide/oligopeptide/nickel transport system permease subunit